MLTQESRLNSRPVAKDANIQFSSITYQIFFKKFFFSLCSSLLWHLWLVGYFLLTFQSSLVFILLVFWSSLDTLGSFSCCGMNPWPPRGFCWLLPFQLSVFHFLQVTDLRSDLPIIVFLASSWVDVTHWGRPKKVKNSIFNCKFHGQGKFFFSYSSISAETFFFLLQINLLNCKRLSRKSGG